MNITLYRNNSENAKIGKSLTTITSKADVQPIGAIDLLSPTFKLSGQNVSNLTQVNYCYVPDYGRYYFCKPILDSTGIYYLKCDVDPLESFKSGILSLTAVVIKAEDGNISNKKINDGSFVSESDEYIQRYIFNAGSGALDGFLSEPKHILICAGGE